MKMNRKTAVHIAKQFQPATCPTCREGTSWISCPRKDEKKLKSLSCEECVVDALMKVDVE